MSLTWLMVTAVVAADPPPAFTVAASPAEYGRGLTPREVREGWLSLFDGYSDFGWQGAAIEAGVLGAGETTSRFGPLALQGEALAAGALMVGDKRYALPQGAFALAAEGPGLRTIRLADGLKLKSLAVRPLGLRAVFDGRGLAGWTVIPHPRLPAERQTSWRVEQGALRAVGGPGALELAGRYGDMVLQLEARTRARLVNGGVFFRSVPGDFLNGYEVQIFNACYGGDPARPARYSTGALDDRQLARRIVSRDEEPFTLLILAVGPRIASWVNGHQVLDWTDTRDVHENPRRGKRLDPGTIQLQAHDAQTDLEFLAVRVAALP